MLRNLNFITVALNIRRHRIVRCRLNPDRELYVKWFIKLKSTSMIMVLVTLGYNATKVLYENYECSEDDFIFFIWSKFESFFEQNHLIH